MMGFTGGIFLGAIKDCYYDEMKNMTLNENKKIL